MSEPAKTPPSFDSNRRHGGSRPRRVGISAALPILTFLPCIAAVWLLEFQPVTLAPWLLGVVAVATMAWPATLLVRRSRELRHEREQAIAYRELADELCAAHGDLAACCEQAASDLCAARASWAALLQGSPHLALLTTDPAGMITSCNPGAERLLRSRADELVGHRSIVELHPGSELAAASSALPASAVAAASTLGAWSALARSTPGATRTWTWQRADGETVRVAASVTPQTDANGAVTGYVVIAHDRTAIERASSQLQALHDAGRALLEANTLADALPKVMAAVSTRFTWESARLWAPPHGEDALRVSQQWQAAGMAAEVPSSDTRTLVERASQENETCWKILPVAAASNALRALYVIPLRLGRTARGVVEVTGQLPDDEGAELGWIFGSLATFVGQFLARKEAEKRMFEAEDSVHTATRAKSDFLALMSHEIRTPMNGVIGMSNLLLETPLSPKQRDFAHTIRSSGDALLTVINDILDFSKIEAGKLAFEYIDFDLRAAIEDTLELMAGNAHAKQLELAAHVHADVPEFVHGDPNRLRQVLNNLVANAIKFTAQGEVVVTVSRESGNDQRVVLHIGIRDTGIGIAPEVQKRLFQPFMQADTSTTRRFGGTGLGLAISRQLVEMMHGRIGVVSEEGKGATFHFTVRFDRAKDPSLVAPERTLAPTGARVLLVDDNPTHAHILGQMFKAWGLRPSRALNAAAALQQLRAAAEAQEPFALAVLDAEMTGGVRTQLAQRIRSTFAAIAPRIILLAGIGQQFEDEELRVAGAGGWITKPVRESRLHETAAAVLAGRSGARPATSRARSSYPSPVAAAPAAPGASRILLVEDNVINQQVALQLLARMGFSADVATNGIEALAALRRAPYEVVLMDCMMPQMDGFETTRRIREIERRRSALGIARPQVHIIALTANTSPEDRARCLAAGMNEFVTKPLRPDDLQELLEHWRASVEARASAVVATGDNN